MPLPGRPRTGRLLLGATVPWWQRARRRTRRWAVAIGLAAAAAGLVQVRSQDAARTLAGLGRTRAVAVARRQLEEGHVLTSDDIVLRVLPVDAVPEGAVGDRDDLTGRTVTSAIVAGEVMSSQRVAPDGLEGIAALVPRGRRAIAIPIEGTGLAVRIDDRVDILDPTVDERESSNSAGPGAVAVAAIVIGVSDSAVTVAVAEDEAAAVAAALGRGTPVLALAGPT